MSDIKLLKHQLTHLRNGYSKMSADQMNSEHGKSVLKKIIELINFLKAWDIETKNQESNQFGYPVK